MRDIRRRLSGAFVNHSVQFLIFALAIWLAIAVPTVASYVRGKHVHACALRLDAAAADPAATERSCPRSGKPYVEREGKLCDEDPKSAHNEASEICSSASEKAVDAHPKPGLLKPALILVISFVVLFGAASMI